MATFVLPQTGHTHQPHEFVPNENERYQKSCRICGRVEDYPWHCDDCGPDGCECEDAAA